MNESEPKPDAAPTNRSRSVDGTRTGYRRIVDSVPGCILVADAEGQIVYANKAAVATLGRSLEDLLRAGWLKSLDCSLIHDAEKTWQRCVQKGEPLNAIWRFRQHDDTYRSQHLKAKPNSDSDSTAVTWYILGIDVPVMLDTTAQRNAELALLQSEQQMQRMIDTVPSMLWSMGLMAA